MAIRLSGMVSGMDTESLVSALVSSYSLKKDNLVKAQTKLSWKQEKWKTMNTSIYSFYSGKLSSARFSTNFNLKTSSVSNSAYAKVTASSSAVNGTQTLKVKQLAATGYLTGGTVSLEDGSAVKGDTKLSDLTGVSSGTITVSSGDKTSDIDITSDMTVTQFTTKLKEAGLNANFDENNKRFFISSKTSGADGDFSLTASDSNGLTALKKMGIYVADSSSSESVEYSRLAALTEGSDAYNTELSGMYTNTTASEVAKSYADQYNTAKAAIDDAKSNSLFDTDIDTTKANRDAKKADFDAKYGSYASTDEDGNVTYDTDKMKEDGLDTDEFTKAKKELSDYDSLISTYEENEEKMSAAADYVTIDSDGKAVADETNTKVLAEVDSTNAERKAAAKASLDDKIATAKSAGTTSSSGAVRIKGQDSEIELNGATFTNNTNNYSINGLTIQALAETGDDAVSITTDTDVDGIYNMIKDVLTDYNTLIKSIDVAYNASSSKGYEPLTSDEKEAMSDDEVEAWETKIKDSLLRKDSTLGSIMNTMKNDMLSSFEIDGKSYALSSFGIATLGYFSSPENETGVFHIDGDTKDSYTSANEDKLRSMIASDPDTVVSFFSQLSSKLYTDLGNKMATSSTSSAYTVYNDKQMNTQYSEYTTKISDAEDLVTTWEDYYYSKFSAMESAMASLNAQSSSLSSML